VRTHIDLFSGIGGFALACRWAGIETVQFVEIDPFCQAVLRKNFPGIPIHDDIKTFKWTGDSPFILTAGVPCQPASRAGKQRGKDDDRWLWPEAIRVLRESRPAWAVFENPPGIEDLYEYGISLDVDAEGNAIGEVGAVVDRVGRSVFSETLEAIENEGYAVQVLEIPACAVNAPHIRNRLWIVGYSSENAGRILHEHRRPRESYIDIGGASSGSMALSRCFQSGEDEPQRGPERGNDDRGACVGNLADAGQEHGQRGKAVEDAGAILPGERNEARGYPERTGIVADAQECGRRQGSADAERACERAGEKGEWLRSPNRISLWDRYQWLPCADGKFRRAPDDSFGLADGIPRKALSGLGNSIVPQIAYEIIKAIVEVDA